MHGVTMKMKYNCVLITAGLKQPTYVGVVHSLVLTDAWPQEETGANLKCFKKSNWTFRLLHKAMNQFCLLQYEYTVLKYKYNEVALFHH